MYKGAIQYSKLTIFLSRFFFLSFFFAKRCGSTCVLAYAWLRACRIHWTPCVNEKDTLSRDSVVNLCLCQQVHLLIAGVIHPERPPKMECHPFCHTPGRHLPHKNERSRLVVFRSVILKCATPLVEKRVAHIISFLKSIFLNIFFFFCSIHQLTCLHHVQRKNATLS